MWKSISGPGGLISALCFSSCIRRCVGALQVTTNLTGSEIDFKERLQIQWSGDSSSTHDVGVQEQSESENGSFVMLSGGNTGSSLDWDFGYDFDVGTYAFVVRSSDEEAQSPLYTLLDPHLATSTSTASSSSATSSSPSTSTTPPTTTPTSSPTSASESTPTTAAASSDTGKNEGLSTGAAIGVGVGVGVVGVVLLGVLLLWMYRKGKKAAAAQPLEAKSDPGQGGFSDHWGGNGEREPLASETPQGPKLSATVSAYGPDAELSGSRDHAELQHAPMYSEIGGVPRSELHPEGVMRAELPPDAEVKRARGRYW